MYKFIQLTNGKIVQAFYESDEDQAAKIAGSKFDFKEFSDGKIAQKIAFVDADGNKVNIFKTPAILDDGNTVLWVDAQENIIKDGSDLVSVWGDKSGENNDLLQAVGANQPLWSTNGILFDGISQFMQTVGFTLVQPEMIYIVFKQVTWGLNLRIMDGLLTNDSGSIQQIISTPGIAGRANNTMPINNNLALNTFGIIRILFNGSASSFQVDKTGATIAEAGSNSMGGFTLGSRADVAVPANIQVKEVIIRKIADSSGDEQDIYDYLAAKYSI